MAQGRRAAAGKVVGITYVRATVFGAAPPGLHADRDTGGHRDYRHPDRPAPARGTSGARGGPANPLHQQPETDRPGAGQLPRHLEELPPGDGLQVPAFLARPPRIDAPAARTDAAL